MITQHAAEIHEFLTLQRIALVGASRDEKQLSRQLMKALAEQGHDVIPVHPEAVTIDGKPCAASVEAIDPAPDAALIMLSGDKFRDVVDQCIRAGIKNVWLYGVAGPKQIDEDLQQYCMDQGINLVAGYCPFMFLEGAGGIHRFHGFIWKLVGLYPKP